MSRVAGNSKHKHTSGVKTVKRSWHPSHIAAGYHEQEFGPHARPDSPLLGSHKSPHGYNIQVSYLEKGDTGPEFHLVLMTGARVTVLDEYTVRGYLALHGIQEHIDWQQQQILHQEAIEHEINRTGLHSLIRDIKAGIEEGGDERIEQLKREYPERL